MSRPPGSEQISLNDLREAAGRLRERIGGTATLSQVALATEAGLSEGGLRAWHRRRGMTWPTLRESLDYLPVLCRSHPHCAGDDADMRSLQVPLSPEAAEQLRELARADRRHPRDEAAVLLADALRRADRQRRTGRQPLTPVA